MLIDTTPTPILQPPQPPYSLRSTDNIAWATVVYVSVVHSGDLNQTHPYVHVRGNGQILLREQKEYDKQQKQQQVKKHADAELNVLAEQYGIVTSKPKKSLFDEDNQPDIDTLMHDETTHRVSIETTLIANGTWVLPNIVEKDAAKWTDSAYGSDAAQAITAQTVVDDTPLQQILKDDKTPAVNRANSP
jgi:hypothetical protein